MTTAINTLFESSAEHDAAGTQASNYDAWILPDIQKSRPYSIVPSLTAEQRELSMSEERETDFVLAPMVSPPLQRGRYGIRPSDRRITLLQQWECIISKVHEEYIDCEMHDLTVDSNPVEQAEVYVCEFSDFDKPLLQEGAVFYWSVGHETSKWGQIRRYSELRVRRMPPLGTAQRRELKKKAEKIAEQLARLQGKNAPCAE